MNRKTALTILVFLLLGLTMRMLGNRWGLVTGKNLADIGYPLPGGFSEDRIVFGYVYDEEMFMSFLAAYSRAAGHVQTIIQGREKPISALKKAYLSLRADKGMHMVPVGPAVFSGWSLATSLPLEWLGLREADPDMRKTHFYHASRVLSAILSIATLFILLPLVSQTLTTGETQRRLLAIGTFLYAFQPASLVHGHWASYNPMVTLFELGATAWAAWLIMSFPMLSLRKLLWHTIGLGIFIGVSIATKFTTASVALVFSLGFILALIQPGWRQSFSHNSWKIMTPLGLIVLNACVVLTYCTVISPSFFTEGSVHHQFGVFTSEFGRNRLQNLTHYFLKTLPAGVGWPVYLCGWGGLIIQLGNIKKAKLVQLMLIALFGITAIALSSKSLGTMPQRSLTVYALWVVFAIWFLNFLYPRIHPIIWRTGVAYLMAGCLFASLQIDINLIKDQPGYRNSVSQYVINHLPKGSRIVLHKRTKHGQVDLSLFETYEKPPKTIYQYDFLYTSQIDRVDFRGYGIYPDHFKGGDALAFFHSPIKQEGRLIRFCRMLLGFHRADQLIDVGSFGIFKIETRKTKHPNGKP